MRVTEYDVGPGAYGVAQAADGAVWTSLPKCGELVRVGPGGHVSRVRLNAAQSRPMVLTRGPDGAIWFSRGDGRIGRVTPAGDVSSVPVATPAGSPYGLCTGPDAALWYTSWPRTGSAGSAFMARCRSTRCQRAACPR
jgi:virginiamycin B lyase